MSEPLKDIFTKVPPNERPKLFRDLEQFKVELICKLPGQEDIIRVNAHAYDSANILVCLLQPGSEFPANLPQSAVVSFVLGEDRFFLTTGLSHSKDNAYALSLAVDIFKLQRRQSYRLRIPESYVAKTQLTTVRGQKANIAGQLQDLSTGGLRLISKAETDIKTGDAVEGIFTLGARPAFGFQALVRHVKLEGKVPKQTTALGLEFTGLTPALEGRLFAFTMELHREFFSRRSER